VPEQFRRPTACEIATDRNARDAKKQFASKPLRRGVKRRLLRLSLGVAKSIGSEALCGFGSAWRAFPRIVIEKLEIGTFGNTRTANMPICKRDGFDLNQKEGKNETFHDNDQVFCCYITKRIFRDYE